MAERAAAELSWDFRPHPSRPAHILTLAGAPVHSVNSAGADGGRLIVLQNGARVRAEREEIVPE